MITYTWLRTISDGEVSMLQIYYIKHWYKTTVSQTLHYTQQPPKEQYIILKAVLEREGSIF